MAGCFLLYLLSLSKNLRAEEDYIKNKEECCKNDQCQHRLDGGEGRQKHQREAEYHCRKVLIYQVVSRRGLEISVDLAEKNDTG